MWVSHVYIHYIVIRNLIISTMNFWIGLSLLIPTAFSTNYAPPPTPTLCDCFDFALAYGYPQTLLNGYNQEICYKFDIKPNPSYAYQCQYVLEYFVLDVYVTYIYIYIYIYFMYHAFTFHKRKRIKQIVCILSVIEYVSLTM